MKHESQMKCNVMFITQTLPPLLDRKREDNFSPQVNIPFPSEECFRVSILTLTSGIGVDDFPIPKRPPSGISDNKGKRTRPSMMPQR